MYVPFCFTFRFKRAVKYSPQIPPKNFPIQAILSIFYGRRVLRRAEIVPDKKKSFIFSSDILKRISIKKSSKFL